MRDFERIKDSLDSNGCFDGLLFAPEMAAFCGRDFLVLKQVRRVMDYYGQGKRILRKTYILADVYCKGSIPYPQCDRSCFYYWKESWLDRIEER